MLQWAERLSYSNESGGILKNAVAPATVRKEKTMRFIGLVLLLAVSSLCWGQRPQPFVAGGGVLNGSGYTADGGAAVGGLMWDTSRAFLTGEVGYETGGKDSAGYAAKGHTRYLQGYTFLRVHNWFVGPGCSWSKLYAQGFDKAFVHPRFAVGREFHSGYLNRLLVGYVQKGTDTSNGVQGITAQAYWFFGKHAFLRMSLDGDWAHATVSPNGSPQLVQGQLTHHITTSDFQGVIGWRF